MKPSAALLLVLALAGACVDLNSPGDPIRPLPDPDGGRKDTSAVVDDAKPGADLPGQGGIAGGTGTGGAGGAVLDAGGTTDESPPPPPPVDTAPEAAPPDVAPPVDMPGNPPTNQGPSVSVAAAASISPVTGTTTMLSVLGADDQGEGALVYTWATKGAAPGPVGFSNNGENGSKTVTAVFTTAGTYTFEVVIRDAGGLATTSSIAVQVSQTPNDVSIAPTMAALSVGGMQQFTASVFDQFGAPLSVQVAPTWALNGACGTLSPSGLLLATAGASCTVTALVGSASDPASVTVGSAAPTVLVPVADAYVEESNGDRNFGSATTLQSKSQNDSNNTRHSYLRFNIPSGSYSKATLRLYGRSSESTTKEQVCSTDNTWSESGITWKNRPSIGTVRSSISITTTAKYREWDVTAAYALASALGQTQLSFALRMEGSTGNSPDSFSSREAGSNPPQLVLTP